MELKQQEMYTRLSHLVVKVRIGDVRIKGKKPDQKHFDNSQEKKKKKKRKSTVRLCTVRWETWGSKEAHCSLE